MDMKNVAPLMLALLVVAAVLPKAERPNSETAQTSAAEAEDAEVARLKRLLDVLKEAEPRGEKPEPTCRKVKGREDEPSPGWCGPVRALREFYGLGPGLDSSRADSVGDLKKAMKGGAGFKPQFMIALVPDPLETTLPINFDLALDAIRRGFAESRYLGDRFWLPWIAEVDKRERLYLEAPGVLLFRKVKNRAGELLIVFLIGESPRAGMHQDAFKEALKLIAELKETAPEQTVSILGPSFSGSVDSLLIGLEQSGKSHEFRIATGTATGSGLEERFSSLPNLQFCRTVVPVETLQRRGLEFLEEMGWDPERTALLVESDTGYGLSTLGEQQQKKRKDIILVPFPSPLSDVRNAWQQDGKAKKANGEVEVGEARIATGRPALDLSLVDTDKSVDVIPSFSELTVPAQDLELSNLLETISREGIRYVGIQATDVKDKLFLMEKIRQFSPDTITFTFENSLVFAHPEYAEAMDGTVVISSSPLFTEGAGWLPASSMTAGRQRRQFTAEFQQGILEAIRYLLKSQVRAVPEVWVSAVGNGSLWPITHLPAVEDSPARAKGPRFCLPLPGKNQPSDLSHLETLAGRTNLQLLLIGGVLCLLSIGLGQVGVLKETVLKEAGGRDLFYRPLDPPLVFLGSLLLVVWGAMLLVVGSLPVWARWIEPDWPKVPARILWVMYLMVLIGIYAFLVLRMASFIRGRLDALERIAWLCGGALVVLALVSAIRKFWIVDDQIAFFHLRARAFSSGFSPLVSLALMGGALFVWILCEVRRRWLFRRQGMNCPVDALCDEDAFIGCAPRLQKLQVLLGRIFPQEKAHWLLPLGVFLPVWLLLLVTIQPITEKKSYGQFFLTLVVITASLAALSFYRFIRIWWNTAHLLRRLDNASPKLVKALQDISGELDWRPMKSFGLRMPSFQILTLSARRLEGLKLRRLPLEPLRSNLKGVFEAEAEGRSEDELEHRKKLEMIFDKACDLLKDQQQVHGAREFLALRIAAYLRYIFAHLRSCLLGALGTGLLLLLSVTAYAFEPKRFVSLAIWLGMAVAVALTLWIFIQMDRNTTLSRIGGTTAGQVSFDRTFVTNLFLYIGIPVLGMVSTQFPAIGRLLGQLSDHFLRIAGGG